MEHSLKTGVQPEAARSIVAPVIDTFAGAAQGFHVCGCLILQIAAQQPEVAPSIVVPVIDTFAGMTCSSVGLQHTAECC
jgi:hypothetical protein